MIERSNLLCVCSVLLTCGADGAAMARHASMWRASTAGQILCALLGVLFLWGVLEVWAVARTTATLHLSARRAPWTWLTVIVAGVILTIGLYPDRWRQGAVGAIVTAALGGPLLFIPMRVAGMTIRPVDGHALGADALDDLSAFCGSMMACMRLRPTHLVHRAIVCAMDGAAAWTRRYWWIFIVAAGMTIGAFLARRELADAHSAFSRTAFVVSVYSGLESGAVLIGALLLSHPLALSRKTTEAAP